MSNQNIKVGITNAFIPYQLQDRTDQLIVSCLLYEVLERMTSKETSLQNDLRALADNYLQGYIKKVSDAKRNLISYEAMRQRISEIGKVDFLSFTRDNIMSVVRIYQDKTAIEKFSTQYFSQYMYKLLNIPNASYTKLSRNHFAVMVPIMSFYIDKFRRNSEDMEILTALGYPKNPGKEVSFKIKEVEPARILADVRLGRIPLIEGTDFHSMRTDGEFVTVVFN